MSRPRRIAVVINLDWSIKRHQQVFAGTQEVARARGWECVLWPHPPDSFEQSGRHRYHGIIARTTPALARLAVQAGIPLVNVWLSSPVRDMPMVGPDARAGGQLAAEHLLARGVRRFGYLGYKRARVSVDFEAGFREVAQREGLDYHRFLVSSSFSTSAAYWRRFQSGLETWLKACKPPLGVLAVSDKPARHLARLAMDLGWRIPEDLAIIGYENDEVVCLNPAPSLTSIEIGYLRIGTRAAELLEDLMDGKSPPADPILLPPVSLIPRDSTDAFSVKDDVVAQALRFIAEESHRGIKVRDVVARVPLSGRSLERRFQVLRGNTIRQEITHMQLERAKRLLVETDFLVKRVASDTGFANTRRLCEVFRRTQGMTPQDYRRKHGR